MQGTLLYRLCLLSEICDALRVDWLIPVRAPGGGELWLRACALSATSHFGCRRLRNFIAVGRRSSWEGQHDPVGARGGASSA